MSEKKEIRSLLSEDVLDEVSGGGKNKEEGGVCGFCGQTYKGTFQKHMTTDCPANGH